MRPGIDVENKTEGLEDKRNSIEEEIHTWLKLVDRTEKYT